MIGIDWKSMETVQFIKHFGVGRWWFSANSGVSRDHRKAANATIVSWSAVADPAEREATPLSAAIRAPGSTARLAVTRNLV